MGRVQHFKTGDRVTVPWGTDELIGVVVDVYGPPSRRFARVRVPVLGSTGETLEETEVAFPEDSLRPAA